jgi:hypothetical protein
MTMPPRSSTLSPGYEAPYRLVVKARSPVRPKGFIWEIVRTGTDETPVERSSESFKTMEDAYRQGSIFLGLIRKPD